MKKEVEVVAAIIIKDNKILCVQRDKSKYDYISYKYEFPGGKVEKNETFEEAIIREIKEELDQEIIIREKYITIKHEYPDFKIIMHSFLCDIDEDTLKLKEHIDLKWLEVGELKKLDWAEADIPIVERLITKKFASQIDNT
jgi:8-oxo-dGTP diphosphatase